MVEINNQLRRSSICWRGRRELITDVRKTRNHGYDVIVGELFTDYSDHPRKLVTLNPKTQINRRRTLPASFPLVGCLPQAAWPEGFLSKKVRTLWHCSRLRSVALYLWLIVVISVRQSTVAAISGLHCRALVMVSSSIRLTAWLQKIQRRSGRNGQRDWCMSEVTAIISALVICIIVCLSRAVNHYRDNAIAYKAKARAKMPENWSWRTRQLLTYGCVSVKCCCARCKIHEELADAKAENDTLRDDVAAGRRRFIKAVCQSVHWSTTASGVDNAASPRLADTAEGILHPQKADHLKATGRNPEVY